MELYFIDDKPRMIYDTWKYARVRSNCNEHTIGGKTYYICDANNYKESIDQLKLRSKQASTNSINEGYVSALIQATGLIIDCDRGDGFLFLMSEFSAWHELLEDITIPDVYL